MGMFSDIASAFGQANRNWPASVAVLAFLTGIGPAGAADIGAPPSFEYTYLTLEGGYIHLDGEDVQAYLHGEIGGLNGETLINVSDGVYGRAEFGKVWNSGLGIGAYVQGWDGDEDVSETTYINGSIPYRDDDRTVIRTFGAGEGILTESSLDRSLIEVGVQLFHQEGDTTSPGGISIGIEPFVAFIAEDANSLIDNGGAVLTRSSDLDAIAYGALLALDSRYHLLDRTVLIGRAAAGAYYADADADTRWTGDEPTADDQLSSDFMGFRGQLAIGIEQLLSETLSIGLIGRLDYWSDFPSIKWTDVFPDPNLFPDEHVGRDNSIASDDLLALSIGARVTINFR